MSVPTMMTEIEMVMESLVSKYKPRWLADKALRNVRRLKDIDRALIWFANSSNMYRINKKSIELGAGNSLIDALLDAYKKKEKTDWYDSQYVPAADTEMKIVDMKEVTPPQKRRVKI
jgi:hypothetical protein